MPSPERRRRTVLVAAAAALLLSACGGGGDPAADRTAEPEAGKATATPSATAAPFNPCDAIDAAAVSKALGSVVRVEKGTDTNVRCALLPAEKDKPTFELSYLWFDGGLDAAWQTMDLPAGKVLTPTIAGADDVRMVVNESPQAYAASAFLQNGSLIQTVNALALPPYDGKAVLRAVEVILTQLSAARQAG